MAITVRKASRSDIDELVLFNAAMAKETEGKTLDEGILRLGVDAALTDPQKGFYLVADADGHCAGGLLVTTEWSDWRNAFFWWIQSVYIRPEYRARGVYRALHDAVIQMARDSGGVCGVRLYVDKNNKGAKATYEKLGMSPARYDFYEIDL